MSWQYLRSRYGLLLLEVVVLFELEVLVVVVVLVGVFVKELELLVGDKFFVVWHALFGSLLFSEFVLLLNRIVLLVKYLINSQTIILVNRLFCMLVRLSLTNFIKKNTHKSKHVRETWYLAIQIRIKHAK